MSKFSMFFLKPVEFLVAVLQNEGLPIYKYANYTQTTYSFGYETTKKLISLGLVVQKKLSNRNSRIFLTEEGRKIVKDFQKIQRLLK